MVLCDYNIRRYNKFVHKQPDEFKHWIVICTKVEQVMYQVSTNIAEIIIQPKNTLIKQLYKHTGYLRTIISLHGRNKQKQQACQMHGAPISYALLYLLIEATPQQIQLLGL